MDEHQEAEPADLVTAGEPDADLRATFGAGVRALHDRLFALAAVITADPVLAEDALATAYAASWDRFRRGGVADLDCYLWRSVARSARRAGRQHRRPVAAPPPVTVASPTSSEAADLLLLVQWTNGMNGGCASTGGTVVTTLPPIVWAAHDDVSGTISGVDFDAHVEDGAWRVTIHACQASCPTRSSEDPCAGHRAGPADPPTSGRATVLAPPLGRSEEGTAPCPTTLRCSRPSLGPSGRPSRCTTAWRSRCSGAVPTRC